MSGSVDGEVDRVMRRINTNIIFDWWATVRDQPDAAAEALLIIEKCDREGIPVPHEVLQAVAHGTRIWARRGGDATLDEAFGIGKHSNHLLRAGSTFLKRLSAAKRMEALRFWFDLTISEAATAVAVAEQPSDAEKAARRASTLIKRWRSEGFGRLARADEDLELSAQIRHGEFGWADSERCAVLASYPREAFTGCFHKVEPWLGQNQTSAR